MLGDALAATPANRDRRTITCTVAIWTDVAASGSGLVDRYSDAGISLEVWLSPSACRGNASLACVPAPCDRPVISTRGERCTFSKRQISAMQVLVLPVPVAIASKIPLTPRLSPLRSARIAVCPWGAAVKFHDSSDSLFLSLHDAPPLHRGFQQGQPVHPACTSRPADDPAGRIACTYAEPGSRAVRSGCRRQMRPLRLLEKADCGLSATCNHLLRPHACRRSRRKIRDCSRCLCCCKYADTFLLQRFNLDCCATWHPDQ